MKINRTILQIHLSTAIVLVLAAGLILYANCRMDVDPPLSVWDLPLYSSGWPWPFYFEHKGWNVYGDYLAYDVLVALGILLVVGLAFEFALRRIGRRATA